MISRNWKSEYTLLFILFASSLFQIFSWSNGQNWGDDFASYILQARSVYEGTIASFVESNSFAMGESTRVIGPGAYPWGLPIILAPVYAVFGLDTMAFKFVILLFFVGFLTLMWCGLRSGIDTRQRILIVSLFGFNPYFLAFGDNVLSDIPFLFFSTAAIVLTERLCQPLSSTRRYSTLIALGVCLFAATAVRSNGVLLVVAYAVMYLIARIVSAAGMPVHTNIGLLVVNEDHKVKGFSLELLLPLVVFFTLTQILTAETSSSHEAYTRYFKQVSFRSILENGVYYSTIFGEFFGHNRLGSVLFGTTIPFAFLGLVESRGDLLFGIIYSVLTLCLLIAWPFLQGLRFAFPLLPVYVYFAVVGFCTSSQRNVRFRWVYRGAVFGLVLYFVALSALGISRNMKQNKSLVDGPYSATSQEMFAAIRAIVPVNEVVVFRKPRALRLFTERLSVSYSHVDDFNNVKWYVFDNRNPDFTPAEMKLLFSRFDSYVVFDNSQFSIVKFRGARG